MSATMSLLQSLFIIILSLFVLSSPSSSSSNPYDNGKEFADCSPSKYRCGQSTYEIYYPFRLQDSPYYCGHPEFDLICNDNTTLLLSIGGKVYQVNSINYATRVLDLTDYYFAKESCPKKFTNTTLNLSLYRYTSNDIEITVYFNCSSMFRPFLTNFTLHNISCLATENGFESFYGFLGQPMPPMMIDALTFCNPTVVVPMNKSAVSSFLMEGMVDFPKALMQGFGLSWKVGEEWCNTCMDSGGICGNDPSSENGEACFCRNAANISNVCTQITGSIGGIKVQRILIGSAVGVGFLLVSLLSALYFYKQRKISSIIFWKKDQNRNQNIEAFLKEYGDLAPKRYSYSDVKKITKSFQEKLGQGGYGTVFKGTISNGHVVAVKILDDSKGDGEEFINEVASIGRTFHVNVVSLLGFCSEGSKRALIYDFMCNGSLEKLVHSEKPKTTLDWEKLYQIAIGIARGLEYLHRGCITRIVHFDIKPHNILLDQDFSPKISDFGLAKLCLKKDSIISIAGARGTIGYIAPEIFSRNFGVVSSKSDVYSYGMMVLEITGGTKNVNVGVENSSEAYFPHWIYEHLDHNGDLLAYGVAAESEETVRKMILVGLWCIQTNPQNRPPMSRVIEMLEGSVHDLQIPPMPYISSSPLGSLMGTSSIEDICWDDCGSLVHS